MFPHFSQFLVHCHAEKGIYGPLGMSVDKAVWMRKTAVANASQQDKYLQYYK